MRIKNTSQYDTAEVRRLVKFAMSEINTVGLQVNVKNCRNAAYAGRAYESVPYESPAHGKAERLVTLRIGAPEKFPCDNMCCVPSGKWHSTEIPPDLKPEHRESQVVFKDGVAAIRWRRLIRRPYGGKSSPLIECSNWREALVAIAAHEVRHIEQYQNNEPRSEVSCEKYAARILKRYRTSLSTTEEPER